MPRKSRPVAERLPAKTDLRGPDDCHFFTGFVASNGYGRLAVPGRSSLGAHVAAWELAHGPVPSGMVVMHTCDRRYPPGDTTYRRCVNVAHLRVATQADNLRWMRHHGRAPSAPSGVRDPQQLTREPRRPGQYGPEPRPVPDRFWEKVDRSGGPDACWLWIGSFFSGREYGQFSYNPTPGVHRTVRAHRLAWELTHGPIPPGLLVLHRCNTPACVRPDHLELGDPARNARWRALSGHDPRGDAHWSRRPELADRFKIGGDHHGEANPAARLTAADVVAIRAARANGETYRAIGERYGIGTPHAYQIANRKIWSHIP